MIADPPVLLLDEAQRGLEFVDVDLQLGRDLEDLGAVKVQLSKEDMQEIATSLSRFIVHGELDYWMPSSAGFPAEITGVARSTVKTRMFYARKSLAKLLAAKDPELAKAYGF